MKNNDPRQRPSELKAYILGGALAWTVIIVISLIWNNQDTKLQTIAKAGVMANLALEKDVSFRAWITSHGGVYVPVTEETPSNPYLDFPGKDEILRSGKRVTLMNPAYVMRQHYEMIGNNIGIKGHLTSLKLINPASKPDPWEEQSLQSFEKGEKQATIIQTLSGTEYVRLMKPLVIEKGCLPCHAAQGYKEGDIRGGLSVSVPITSLRLFEREYRTVILGYHVLVWVLGLAGILLFGRSLLRAENERVQAEQVIRLSEEKLTKVFNASPDWLSITTLEDGRFIDVNNTFVFMSGYKREEAIGKNKKELGLWINPEAESCALEMLREHGSLHDFEVKLRMKSGQIRVMLWSAEKIELKGHRYRVNVFKDITERKEIEETLQKRESQLSIAVQLAKLGYWEYDIANDLFTFNDHFYAIFRTTAEEVGGYTMSSAQYAEKFIHPDDKDVVGIETRKAIETTDHHFSQQLEHRIIYGDGEIGYINILINIVKDTNGRTIKTYGVNQDITERKEIEVGLEKTREELAVIKIAADEVSEYAESLINTVREPLIALDQNLRVVSVSRSFYDFFKVKPEETVGQLIYDIGNKQ